MIVIIPCWRRPAHLAALLRTIERARGASAQRYIFIIDRGYAPEIRDVIDGFALRNAIAGVLYHGEHGYMGPAYNILRGWGAGLVQANRGEPIGLLEEDLLVSEDIFEFWRDALALSDELVDLTFQSGFCGVSACRNQNLPPGEGPWADHPVSSTTSYVYWHTSYQSLAVALWPSLIAEVLTHATPEYFAEPSRYVERHLFDADLPRGGCSQDALFHRVIRRERLKMLYPVVPRAFHAGWYGYNRCEGQPQTPVQWRRDAEKILAMTSEKMNELADPRYRDIERCALTRPRAALKLV